MAAEFDSLTQARTHARTQFKSETTPIRIVDNYGQVTASFIRNGCGTATVVSKELNYLVSKLVVGLKTELLSSH
jgi:hypothetical protein